jgi:hypothetical protein
MSTLDKIRDFYRNGTDPEFSPQPNHVFTNHSQKGGDRVYLLPGHFYSFLNLTPIGPDQVPTIDEYEILRNPSLRDQSLVSKYKIRLPYYDNQPIFLALDQYGLGLNIKIMSQFLRKRFIRTYMLRMQPALDLCFKEGELLPIRQRPSLNSFLSVNLGFIKQVSGLDDLKFNLLVNKYNREQMRNLTLIDWDTVPNLHLANYSTDRLISTRSSFSLFEIK